MSSIFKRGRYYYITFYRKLENQKEERPTKSLGIRYKDQAEKAQEKLDDLFERGKINPFAPKFDPKKILNHQDQKVSRKIYTVRQAADYFYEKKDHLSNQTVNANAKDESEWGAYQRAIEHFIDANDINDLPINSVTKQHFENIIYKKGIESATRDFYFRQFRAWWNKLMEWEVVSINYLKTLKRDLPDVKTNMIPKMLNERELAILFEAFDTELERKRARADYDESLTQHWFKPLICCYFWGGLRKHEAAFSADLDYSGLKGQNLQYLDGNLAMIYLEATKGRKERMVPVGKEWRRAMEQYFEIRGAPGPEQYVFIYLGGSRKGWPVTGGRAYREYKRYLKEAGLPTSRTLHGMRHERVTNWLDDYTPAETQFMAGHTSAKTTGGYTHLRGSTLLKKQREIDKQNSD